MVIYASRGPVRDRAARGASRASDPTEELARLYAEHAGTLLRLAALLVRDTAAAREIMYEAFAAMERVLLRRRPGDALAFLLRDIVSRARLVVPGAGPDASSPDAAVMDLLRALPSRQREALVLRYYGQFSDDEVAAAMGVTRAELRTNVVRGMAALQLALGSPLPAEQSSAR